MPSFDFFLAHAGPDTAQAERLYGLLAAETSVFLDSKSILPGDDWDRVIAEAQRQSRVTVVLVSANTQVAFYQREEIAAAIELARTGQPEHTVVPVYLESAVSNVPYGLRLKHSLAISSRQPIEQVAARLIDLHRILVAKVVGPATEPVATFIPEFRSSRAELIEQLFDRDPLVSLSAVAGLTELGTSGVPDVIGRLSGLNQVNILVVRSLLARFPEESAQWMSERVLNAHRDWDGATFVPDCFTPRHRPFCADLLAGHLDNYEPDVVRKCVESLGFMAAETWGYRIVELMRSSDDDLYRKYASYVIPARARMLVLLDAEPVVTEWRLPIAFSEVERVIAEASRRGWQSIQYPALRDVLSKCQPRHADHLLSSWLTAADDERPALAVRALGQMRLRRSLPHLAAKATNAAETDEVMHEAIMAIANIGGPDAVTILEDLLDAARGNEQRSKDLRAALVHCMADAADDDQFARLAHDILAYPISEACFVHRAIGLRRDDRFLNELHRGLESTATTVRGQSALALARIEGANACSSLVRAHAEAATTQERILASLALLSIGEAIPDDAELLRLRVELSQESFRYKRLVTDDIVQVLSASQHPRAVPISVAWQGLYTEKIDY